MTKVFCGYILCQHNSSNRAGGVGLCKRKVICLKYRDIELDDMEHEMLDCEDFKWDNDKRIESEATNHGKGSTT